MCGGGKYRMKLFSIEDIIELFQQLNEKHADELEGQLLDFKEWNFTSLKDSDWGFNQKSGFQTNVRLEKRRTS